MPNTLLLVNTVKQFYVKKMGHTEIISEKLSVNFVYRRSLSGPRLMHDRVDLAHP